MLKTQPEFRLRSQTAKKDVARNEIPFGFSQVLIRHVLRFEVNVDRSW